MNPPLGAFVTRGKAVPGSADDVSHANPSPVNLTAAHRERAPSSG
jgi:hypothetical protein